MPPPQLITVRAQFLFLLSPVVNNELAIVGSLGSAGKAWRRSDERCAVVSCADPGPAGSEPGRSPQPQASRQALNIPLSLHGGGPAQDEISAGL